MHQGPLNLSLKQSLPAVTHLPHAPHDAELLRVDEALQHHPDGHVDVVLQHVVPQVHLGVSLRHADHRLDVADSDGDAARGLLGRPQNMCEISLSSPNYHQTSSKLLYYTNNDHRRHKFIKVSVKGSAFSPSTLYGGHCRYEPPCPGPSGSAWDEPAHTKKLYLWQRCGKTELQY